MPLARNSRAVDDAPLLAQLLARERPGHSHPRRAPSVVRGSGGRGAQRLATGSGSCRDGMGALSVAARQALRVVLVLVGCLLGIAGLVRSWSPGKPRPFVDEHGDSTAGQHLREAVGHHHRCRTGDVPQGAGPADPGMLYLHGGPGLPEYWLIERYPSGRRQHFTVGWWEQRSQACTTGAMPRSPIRR